jgi:pimeloyl-ACP methyl ester carboxylesterase
LERTGYHVAPDGTQLWWGAIGKGPLTLVLNDGFACDGFIWPYLIDHFHEDFQLIRWHYRGHGQSQAPLDDDAHGIENIVDDLHGLLDALEVDRAVLLGHSMGVQVILQYAGLHPDRVEALVPICGTYKRPLDTFHDNDRLMTLLPFLDRIVNAAPDQVQTIWETLTPSRFSKLLSRVEINARLVRTNDFLPYLEHVAQMDVQVFVRMLRRLAEHSAEDVLHAIGSPTLVIAGEHDTFTPLYRSEEMSELIPASELLVVPSGTHVAPLELPELVNSAIEKFLLQRVLGHRAHVDSAR